MSTAALIRRLKAASVVRGRDSQGAMWDRSCDVLRRGAGTDRFGRPSTGAEAVTGTFPCSLVENPGPGSNTEAEESDRTASLSLWRVSLPVGADVRTTDRLRVFGLAENGARIGGGTDLEVTATNADQSGAFQLLVYAKKTGGAT